VLGTKKIHFSGGDPMLRPQIPDLIGHASSLDMRVTITTNGTLIDKARAKNLVESGRSGVTYPFIPPLRKMHEKIRGMEGALKATVKGIALFRRDKHKGKLADRTFSKYPCSIPWKI
jgi:MoaA/NifB/PqqE/SkfB family radical SAM enzyme